MINVTNCRSSIDAFPRSQAQKFLQIDKKLHPNANYNLSTERSRVLDPSKLSVIAIHYDKLAGHQL